MPEMKVDSPLAPGASGGPVRESGGNGAGGAPSTAAAQPQPEAKASEAPPKIEPPGTLPPDVLVRWEKGKCLIPLHRKVQAHGEEVDALTLREPTILDIENIGNPVLMNVFEMPPKTNYDAAVMTNMISTLATVPTSTVRKLDTRDWYTCALALFHFFIPSRWVLPP